MHSSVIRVLLLTCLIMSLIYVSVYMKITQAKFDIWHTKNSANNIQYDIFEIKVKSKETKIKGHLDYPKIDMGNKLPLLTLFTTWRNTKDKERVIKNTIQNWRTFHQNISTVAFSNSMTPLHRYAQEQHWKVLKSKTATNERIPLFRDMFAKAMTLQSSVFYGYANSDILFTPSLLKTLNKIISFKHNNSDPVLIVGQRTDISIVNMSFPNNISFIIKEGLQRGKLNRPDAIDYFIISKDFPLHDFPDVVVGRIAYDNYVIMHARAHRVAVIDATKTIPAIHQTTRAGNMEGHMHRNKLYNKDLLKKSLQINTYEGGLTSCSNYVTDFNSRKHDVNVLQRKSKPKFCVKMFESW